MHDTKKEAGKFLFKKENLKNQIAKFKKCMRRIAAEWVQEEHEWILDTCYSRANRLKTAGISNKHAGGKGMPKLDKEERVLIMQTLMSLRGKGTAKHREAQAKGKLKIKKAPLTYSHIMDPVEDLVGRMQSRTNTSAATFMQKDEKPKKLNDICCPKCMEGKSTEGIQIKSNNQFSNILCGHCSEVSD